MERGNFVYSFSNWLPHYSLPSPDAHLTLDLSPNASHGSSIEALLNLLLPTLSSTVCFNVFRYLNFSSPSPPLLQYQMDDFLGFLAHFFSFDCSFYSTPLIVFNLICLFQFQFVVIDFGYNFSISNSVHTATTRLQEIDYMALLSVIVVGLITCLLLLSI